MYERQRLLLLLLVLFLLERLLVWWVMDKARLKNRMGGRRGGFSTWEHALRCIGPC